MNKYLSAKERERLLVLLLFHAMMEDAVDDYAKFKANRKFLGNLRRSKSFLKKSLDQRMEFLDYESKLNLLNSVGKIGFTITTKRERDKVRSMPKDPFILSESEMKDWLEFVIEHSCKTCCLVEYENCPCRKIMTRNSIPPYNPKAKVICQYSCVGDTINK